MSAGMEPNLAGIPGYIESRQRAWWESLTPAEQAHLIEPDGSAKLNTTHVNDLGEMRTISSVVRMPMADMIDAGVPLESFSEAEQAEYRAHEAEMSRWRAEHERAERRPMARLKKWVILELWWPLLNRVDNRPYVHNEDHCEDC